MSRFVLLGRTVPGGFYSPLECPGKKCRERRHSLREVGNGMGCTQLLEPKWHGVHDLLTRLLGRCTCEAGDAHVVELYRPADAREVAEAS